MPRLFTAIEIPEDIRAELALARGGLFGARWLESADYHVTLRFVGDVDGRVAHEIADTLFDIRRPPVEMRFDGLGAFGGGRPRTVVARLRPTPQLLELQGEHERRLRRIGLAPETRKFTPHVTLAGLNRVSAAALADYLQSRAERGFAAFTATRFVLYSARPRVGGGPYVVEAAYPLQ
jgi:2'-5' RNA ligase